MRVQSINYFVITEWINFENVTRPRELTRFHRNIKKIVIYVYQGIGDQLASRRRELFASSFFFAITVR